MKKYESYLGPKSRAGFKENPQLCPKARPTTAMLIPTKIGMIPPAISFLESVTAKIEITKIKVPTIWSRLKICQIYRALYRPSIKCYLQANSIWYVFSSWICCKDTSSWIGCIVRRIWDTEKSLACWILVANQIAGFKIQPELRVQMKNSIGIGSIDKSSSSKSPNELTYPVEWNIFPFASISDTKGNSDCRIEMATR